MHRVPRQNISIAEPFRIHTVLQAEKKVLGAFHIFTVLKEYTHTRTQQQQIDDTHLHNQVSNKSYKSKVLLSKFVQGLRRNVAFDMRYVVDFETKRFSSYIRKTFKFNLILLLEICNEKSI